LLFLIAVVSAQPCLPANGGPATNVFGAPDFVTPGGGASLAQFQLPTDVKVDFVSRKVFVVDLNNHRVERFPSAAAFLNGQSAEATIGTGACLCGTNSLCQPIQIAIFGGTCYIADFGNTRVVRLTGCASVASGAAFDGVFGQASTAACTANQGVMFFPDGVAVDQAGNLYVADLSPLVYRFNNAQAAANGVAPSGFFGINNTFVCTASTFGTPSGLWVDPFTGVLFVADFGCNRVLAFNQALGLPDGSGASSVFGQPNLASGASGCNTNALFQPGGVLYDQNSNFLFVADTTNNRVVGFPGAIVGSSAANNPSATFVVGQATLGVCTPNPISATSLFAPQGVYFDAFGPAPNFNLLVADSNNSRVLRYQCPPSVSNSVSGSSSNSNSVTNSNSNTNSVSNTNSGSVTGSITNSNSRSASTSNSNTNSWTPSTSPSNSATSTNTATSSPSVTPIFCGNGVVDPGEQCDPGRAPFGHQTCCNNRCQFKTIKSICGPKKVTCKTSSRCELNITTGQVFCRAGKNRKDQKFCKTPSIPTGGCVNGVCVAKP